MLVGFLSVWIGATVGSCISMLLGRFVFIEWVNKQKQKYPLIKAINIAIQSEGLLLIFLLRLCPVIPYNILNYLMGTTEIQFRDFMLGCVGMVPGVLVYVFIGTTISDLASLANGSKGKGEGLAIAFMTIGSTLACGGVLWTGHVAKRKLKELTSKIQIEETLESQGRNLHSEEIEQSPAALNEADDT